MASESIIRPIACTYLGKQTAEKLTGPVKSAGRRKSRLVFEFGKHLDDGTVEKIELNRHAIFASKIQSHIPSRRYRKESFANVRVITQEGVERWVEVNLGSISKRCQIDLAALKMKAKCENRDITEFVRSELLSQSLEEVPIEELVKNPRGVKDLSIAQTLYDEARILDDGSGKLQMLKQVAKKYNYPPAIYRVGKYYLNEGCRLKENNYFSYEKAPNLKKAKKYFEKAVQLGHIPSKLALGVLLCTEEDGLTSYKARPIITELEQLYEDKTAIIINSFFLKVQSTLEEETEIEDLQMRRGPWPGHKIEYFIWHIKNSFISNVILSEAGIINSSDECLDRIDERIKALKAEFSAYRKQIKNPEKYLTNPLRYKAQENSTQGFVLYDKRNVASDELEDIKNTAIWESKLRAKEINLLKILRKDLLNPICLKNKLQ